MKSKTHTRTFCIGAYFNRKSKASREQVAGIFRFAGSHPDWEVHLFTRPDTPSEMRKIIKSFVPDGIITGHAAVITAVYQRLKRRIPSVLIDYAEISSSANARVVCNDHAIGAEAAELFLKRGYKSFAFAGISGEAGDSDAVNSKNRENGFCRKLAKAGFSCAVYRELLDRNTLHYTNLVDLKDWLRKLPKPCALMAHSDLLAQSILSACRMLKITVPDQIAVIGVDNEEAICESTFPKISSIEPDFAGGGYKAAEILDHMLRNGNQLHSPIRALYGILKTEERLSTQNVSGAHLRVARTLEMIRAEAKLGIRPVDIARRLGISPRMLEITMRNTLGRSIRDELITIRIQTAKHLLTTTTKSIATIAEESGFRTPSAFKAIFRKRVGCSPRGYRLCIISPDR